MAGVLSNNQTGYKETSPTYPNEFFRIMSSMAKSPDESIYVLTPDSGCVVKKYNEHRGTSQIYLAHCNRININRTSGTIRLYTDEIYTASTLTTSHYVYVHGKIMSISAVGANNTYVDISTSGAYRDVSNAIEQGSIEDGGDIDAHILAESSGDKVIDYELDWASIIKYEKAPTERYTAIDDMVKSGEGTDGLSYWSELSPTGISTEPNPAMNAINMNIDVGVICKTTKSAYANISVLVDCKTHYINIYPNIQNIPNTSLPKYLMHPGQYLYYDANTETVLSTQSAVSQLLISYNGTIAAPDYKEIVVEGDITSKVYAGDVINVYVEGDDNIRTVEKVQYVFPNTTITIVEADLPVTDDADILVDGRITIPADCLSSLEVGDSIKIEYSPTPLTRTVLSLYMEGTDTIVRCSGTAMAAIEPVTVKRMSTQTMVDGDLFATYPVTRTTFRTPLSAYMFIVRMPIAHKRIFSVTNDIEICGITITVPGGDTLFPTYAMSNYDIIMSDIKTETGDVDKDNVDTERYVGHYGRNIHYDYTEYPSGVVLPMTLRIPGYLSHRLADDDTALVVSNNMITFDLTGLYRDDPTPGVPALSGKSGFAYYEEYDKYCTPIKRVMIRRLFVTENHKVGASIKDELHAVHTMEGVLIFMQHNSTTMSAAAITDVSTTVTLSSATAAQASGIIQIDNELMTYTRSNSNNAILNITRGEYNTKPDYHHASSAVLVYDSSFKNQSLGVIVSYDDNTGVIEVSEDTTNIPTSGYLLIHGEIVSYTRGVDIVVNGTFTTDTGWSKHAHWTIPGGAGATAASATSSEALTPSAAMSTVVNQQYYFTYTITQYTSGKLQPKLGSTLLTERDSVGTYTEIVTCPTNGAKPIFVGGTVAFVGSIDDVQLTPVVTELALTNRAKYGSTRSTHYTGELVYYISTFGLSNMTTVNNYTTEYDGSYRPTVQLPLMLSNDPSWTGAVPIYIVEVEYAEANYNTVRQ